MHHSRSRSPSAIDFARAQRRTSNESASAVWQWLRNRQCCQQKFRREVPIAPYTVDFCCIELRLIVEIDGAPHFTEEGQLHDRYRDLYLQRLGYKILRIPGFDVIREPYETYQRIHQFVRASLG